MDNSYSMGLAPPPWVDKGGVRYESILDMIEEKKKKLEKVQKSDDHVFFFGGKGVDQGLLPGKGDGIQIPVQQVQALRNIFGVDATANKNKSTASKSGSEHAGNNL